MRKDTRNKGETRRRQDKTLKTRKHDNNISKENPPYARSSKSSAGRAYTRHKNETKQTKRIKEQHIKGTKKVRQTSDEQESEATKKGEKQKKRTPVERLRIRNSSANQKRKTWGDRRVRNIEQKTIGKTCGGR